MTSLALGAHASEAPHVRRDGAATHLIVDGAPFLIRGGELGNSSGEPGYLQRFWPRLEALNLNFLLVPVAWDMVEPKEGTFDFSALDGMIAEARARRLRLGLLWFGAWKNSMSCYAPEWVKRDTARFPRCREANGAAQEILSPFSVAVRGADERAFVALMRHLRAIDGEQHTVIMVQVENEIGAIPGARDRSPEADALYAGAVPEELLRALGERESRLTPELRSAWYAAGRKTSGSWESVFGAGDATEEFFMAWHYARYVEVLAKAGKEAYRLPMFVNAALMRPGYRPGQYPSAGPLPHLFDLWQIGAPSIDFLAPDIYFPNFVEWTGKFTRPDNPLFIPEALRNPDAAANALFAFGQHEALGFCPFGIESIEEPAASYLAASFDVVRQITPLLTSVRGQKRTAGLLPAAPDLRQPLQVRLGDWILRASFEKAAPPSLADGVIIPMGAGPAGSVTLPAGGLVVQLGPDEFLFAGAGVTVTFEPAETGYLAGIGRVSEGSYENGEWKHLRWLNGDQTHQGRHMRLEPGRFALQRLSLYRYR